MRKHHPAPAHTARQETQDARTKEEDDGHKALIPPRLLLLVRHGPRLCPAKRVATGVRDTAESHTSRLAFGLRTRGTLPK